MPSRVMAVSETVYRVRRKVCKVGGSLVLSIPKIWADAKRVKKGDEVTVLFDGILKVITDSDLPDERTKSRVAKGP